MNKTKTINPRIINDAAAYLYWTLAENIGVGAATDEVLTSKGRCLLNMQTSKSILDRYDFYKLNSIEQQEAAKAIALEANSFAVKEENNNGTIYGEDAKTGRAPSAQNLQTEHLARVPQRINITGATIGKIGWLCLRQPLPAVVFSETRPGENIFQIANTFLALGFDIPMFFINEDTYQLNNALFASIGKFLIPVPDIDHGGEWNKLIQNSLSITDCIEFYKEKTKVSIEIFW